nr:hypothetical protein [Chloroflexota bacterium]
MSSDFRRFVRVAACLVLAAAFAWMAAPSAWAGPLGADTLPTSVSTATATAAMSQTPTVTPTPTATCPSMRTFTLELPDHTISITAHTGCPGWSWSITRTAVRDIPLPPKGITFSDAVTFSGLPPGYLPASAQVCFSTTDSKAVIYYFDNSKLINRWVLLRTRYDATTKMVCTNVRFGNVTFALGHK